MKRKLITITWGLLALVLLALNIQVATAHRWSSWHQPDKSVSVWNNAVRRAEAEAALNDWDTKTELSFPRRTSHGGNMSVYDGNFGDTGWSGLASIEDTGFGWWDCWWWCHVDHGHARVNTFYTGNPAGLSNTIQGIFCQEIGHLLGLAHPWIGDTGGCMGFTYDSSVTTVSPHNASDINAMY